MHHQSKEKKKSHTRKTQRSLLTRQNEKEALLKPCQEKSQQKKSLRKEKEIHVYKEI